MMLSFSFVMVVVVSVLAVISLFDVVLFLVIFGRSKTKTNRELEDEEQALYLQEFLKNKKGKKFVH